MAGDTAQIRFDVTINTESDQGFGFGVYRSQAEVVATLPSGVVVGDRSDNGSDPDPNGNGDPSEAGEEDFTPVVIAGNPAVGVAKKALVNGTQVTFEFTITNLGDVTLSNFLLTDPLNPVFGSGNYSIQTQPVRVSGATTLLLSPQFFGFNIFDRIVVGGTLRPGETEVVRTQINVNTVTDLGNGFGIYNNSVTVTATGPDGAMVTDVSDDGVVADPNGNGDAGDAGEDDPTRIIIGDEARIGIAQAASVSGQQVTLDFYIENFGNSALSNLSLIEDLDAVFGAGNYALAAPPSLVDDPGTLTLNAGFDGSASAELIGAGSTLLALDTAQIRLVIDVTPTDQGAGLGNYSDQVSISATAPLGSLASDVSDSGTDPDPNGNGFSNDEAESDRTVFSVSTSQLGAALNATVSGRVVTLDYYIENLGSTPFANASASQDLDAVFGAGNYRLLSGPTQVSTPRALILNSAFDGSGDTQLISSGGISLGVTEQIRLVVSVDRLADLGSGLGVYNAQFTALADATSDLSDAGTVTDANNSGFANEAGEDDPTGFSVAQEPVVGVAKTVGVSGSNAQVDLYLESFANVELSNLSLIDDLDAVFGAGNYSIGTGPVLIDDPGTLALNPGFNGSSSADLLAAGSTLAIGDTAQLRFSVIISNPTDQGSGLGRFSNQATVSAQAPDSSSFNDASDDGVDPDADGDGNPNETGENDPSVFELQSRIDGLVYTDLNGDGSPAGEPGRSGVTVFLDSNGNGSLDGGEPSRVTDGAGLYSFIGLANGSYQVRVDLAGIPSGFVLTGGVNPALLTPVPGQTAAVNFGFQQQDAGIGDLVWNDLNGDGAIDGGEPGLGGVTVYLDLNSNGSLDGGEPSSVSDGSGAYALGGLAAGSYLVRIDPTTVPAGFVLTGGTLPLTLNLAAGEVRSTADFGYQQQDASIGDLVWSDLNGNGLVDGGEPGLSGVRVYLDLNNNNIAEAGEPQALTDGSGAYDFTALGAGAYVVRIDPSTVPLTLGLTTGNLPLSVSLAAGEDFNSADFGYVQRVEPGFAKAFANEPIRVAESVALVFTIDNSGSAFVASALAFTDALPAGMTVASPANASTTCSGGTLAAVAGSSTFSYSGGTLAAGSVCTVTVDVRVAAAGTYMNTSGDLTSSLGNSGPASATLRAVDSALTLSKTWLSAPVLPGGNVALRYRIENGSADFGADAVAFDDNLDQALAGLVRTNTLAVTGCGPTASISGTSTVSVSGLSIAAGSACEVDVQVQVPVAASNGSYAGSTGPLTASVLGLSVTGSAASASLDVARLAFSKAFVGTPLAAGTIDLLFTLSNPDPVNGASGISFVDDLSLMGIALSAEGLPASNVCGAGSSLTGPSSLQLSSGSLPGGGQCQFVARLRLPTLLTNGTYPNVTGPLQSTVNGLAVAGGSADVAAAELQISGVPLQPASPTIVPAAQSWVLALLASLLALVAVLQIRSRQ